MYSMPQMLGRGIGALAGGHQQLKLLEHSLHGTGLSVIPGQDTFGRIATADEIDLDAWPHLEEITGNVGEQATVADMHLVAAASPVEHLHPVLDAGSMQFLVRVDARDHADRFVHYLKGRVHQRQMRVRHRVERAGEHPNLANHRNFLISVAEFRPSGKSTE